LDEGRVVNLRQARKRREREREAAAAAENRIVFGMTKAERRKVEAERAKAERVLDSHKLDHLDGG
jgi:Domain of unknown function (DUF4169)